MSQKPQPAATVALIRDGQHGLETLLLKRNANHAFAPSAWVYPGGAVEPEDRALSQGSRVAESQQQAQQSMAEEVAVDYWLAAIRECFEEAGVLVGCRAGKPLHQEALATAQAELNIGAICWQHVVELLDIQFDLAALTYFAHWTTPPGFARCYATAFFVAALPDGQRPNIDHGEIIEGRWLTPQAAIDRYGDDWRVLLPPTVATLKQLSRFDTVAQALTCLQGQPVVRR